MNSFERHQKDKISRTWRPGWRRGREVRGMTPRFQAWATGWMTMPWGHRRRNRFGVEDVKFDLGLAEFDVPM